MLYTNNRLVALYLHQEISSSLYPTWFHSQKRKRGLQVFCNKETTIIVVLYTQFYTQFHPESIIPCRLVICLSSIKLVATGFKLMWYIKHRTMHTILQCQQINCLVVEFSSIWMNFGQRRRGSWKDVSPWPTGFAHGEKLSFCTNVFGCDGNLQEFVVYIPASTVKELNLVLRTSFSYTGIASLQGSCTFCRRVYASCFLYPSCWKGRRISSLLLRVATKFTKHWKIFLLTSLRLPAILSCDV